MNISKREDMDNITSIDYDVLVSFYNKILRNNNRSCIFDDIR